MKRTWVVIFLIAIVMLASGVIFGRKTHDPASIARGSILNDCNNNHSYSECIENKIYAEVKNNPQAAGKLLKEVWSMPNVDLRTFSPMAHNVGMQLIESKLDIPTSIAYCGHSFKDACIHGVVMEYLDNTYPGLVSPNKFIGVCDSLRARITDLQYKACVHAIGHELRAKTASDNNQVIKLCDYFELAYRNACGSGVLMEASTGNQGSGHHSESDTGAVGFECRAIPVGYQHTCYASAGSYRQYAVNSEPWEKTFAFCMSAPIAERPFCFEGADERLLMSKAGDKNAASGVCYLLPREEQKDCLMVTLMSLQSLE